MANQPIKISDNCWKHTIVDYISYKKTSDPNSEYHREDGPAIEWESGDKFWYMNDVRHRTDGPAVELANGTKKWYINGNYHRKDGPAIEYASGAKYWYINGKLIDVNSQEEFEIYIKNLIFI